jgi:hypothetical protein
MASSRSFFEIVGPGFLQCWVPSRAFAGDASLLTGQTATRLRPGEFLEIVADGKVDRGSADGGTIPAFPYFSETGRGDIVTGGKVPVIFGPTYEAETKLVARTAAGVMDADNAGGATAFAIGDRLCVCDVYAPDDLVNKVYRGVRKMTAAEVAGLSSATTSDELSTNPVEHAHTVQVAAGKVVCVGVVTRVLTDSIRFISTLC